jgi:ABC-2 type transport system ATP-binding protein
MTAVALEARQVKKVIRTGFWGKKVTLLTDVSFSVAPGCVFGFVGPNGAGKSTTIKLMLGAARPTQGEVRVLGASPFERSAKARVGYLPELPAMPESLSGRELLRLHARLAGLETGRIERRIDELFERVDLTTRGEQRIKTFSKGMQQRLLLASALLGEPELLILDEPMSGLDPLGRRLVRELIADERRAGHTVFFSSHVLSDVEALSDEVALLVRGRVRRTGPLDEVVSPAEGGWEVFFEPPPGELPASIAALGEIAPHDGASALLIGAEDEPFAKAQALTAAGGRVLSVAPRRASLEDELTKLLEEDVA